METTTKIAVGLSALCCLATTAFAGGVEHPMSSVNGFNFGLGFGYNTYKYDHQHSQIDAAQSFTVYNQIGNPQTAFSGVGEVGYSHRVAHSGLFGFRAYYSYDNARQASFLSGDGASDFSYQIDIQYHSAIALLGGILLNDNNAVYLEAGYVNMTAKSSLRDANNLFIPGTADVPGFNKLRLNGGLGGVGYRHYFANNIYTDVSYEFEIYRDNDGYTTAHNSAGVIPGFSSGLTKTTIQGVLATVNYLFQA